MAKAKTKQNEVAILNGGRVPLVPLPGVHNIRTLSARYIADLQTDWEKHGMAALKEYREKFVDRYVENYAMLARVIRLEADVKHTVAKPKTIAEALDELEGKVGKDALVGVIQIGGLLAAPFIDLADIRYKPLPARSPGAHVAGPV